MGSGARGSGASGQSSANTRTEAVESDDRSPSVAASQRQLSTNAAEKIRRNASAKLANPLADTRLEEMGESYAKKHHIGDEEDIRAFRKGACLAQDPRRVSDVLRLYHPFGCAGWASLLRFLPLATILLQANADLKCYCIPPNTGFDRGGSEHSRKEV